MTRQLTGSPAGNSKGRRPAPCTPLRQFLDHFGRNPREILQRYWELKDAGVSVVATDKDINEELISLVKAGIAEAESRRTSERMRANTN